MKRTKNFKITLLTAFIILISFAFTLINPTIEIGDPAPPFMANDQNGELWNSSDYYGKGFVIVYFYPAALTGGCTKQACNYRDFESSLNELDVEVVGVSGDAVKNLKIFEKEYQLNFTLLSDITGEIANKFGVPTVSGGVIDKEISSGKISLARSLTTKRWTFIIDKNNKIVYKDMAVNASEDSKKVIEFIKQSK
ncbi:MAG: peroxiredoxin [Bacteroidetes bacterium]|nr:MAG: peroxiredoxin [Bacteroidota bacterium]RLD83622.1 MAG: peroxiredoxin [Bacteroidota bacterium]